MVYPSRFIHTCSGMERVSTWRTRACPRGRFRLILGISPFSTRSDIRNFRAELSPTFGGRGLCPLQAAVQTTTPPKTTRYCLNVLLAMVSRVRANDRLPTLRPSLSTEASTPPAGPLEKGWLLTPPLGVLLSTAVDLASTRLLGPSTDP